MQFGMGPGYRLYETADGWLCVAAFTDEHWRSMRAPSVAPDWVQTSDSRLPSDASSTKRKSPLLEPEFQERTATDAFVALDAAGVPCEVSDEMFVEQVFDNPDMISRGLVVTQQHPQLGRFETVGTMIDFSDTPSTIWGPPPLVGQHSREILREFGLDDAHRRSRRRQGRVRDLARAS